MMSLWQAAVLGIVQGLTEFLPVSSSGHLVFFQALFGMKEPMLSFDVALHAGTLAAVFVYFRTEIAGLFRDFWRSFLSCLGPCQAPAGGGSRLWFDVLLTLVPTGLIAIVFKDYFEAAFSDLFAVGWQWILMGALLLFGAKIREGTRGLDAIGWGRSLVIGLAQAAALVPAISRSGSTILAGMACGVKQEDAARFSFLISIPAVLAAVILEVRHGGVYFAENLNAVMTGFLASAVSGYAVIRWLMGVIRQGRFHIFGYYCLAVGALSLVLAKFVL